MLNLEVKRAQRILIEALFGLSVFIVSLSLSWVILAQQSFLYGFWHDYGGIAEGIEKYGPENRYRPGFADTSRTQRIALFERINRAVHNHGEGLETIIYETPSSKGEQNLLRPPEIIHLQDVAHLIDKLAALVWVNLLVLLGLVWLRIKRFGCLPSPSRLIIGLTGILSIVGMLIFIFGRDEVFNSLHIWIFPDNHQWFFYYQESLMSTMMYAPLLFYWIALAWLGASLVFFAVFMVLLSHLNIHLIRRHKGPRPL